MPSLSSEDLTAIEDMVGSAFPAGFKVSARPSELWKVGAAREVPSFPLRRNSLGMIAPSGESPGGRKRWHIRNGTRVMGLRPSFGLPMKLVGDAKK